MSLLLATPTFLIDHKKNHNHSSSSSSKWKEEKKKNAENDEEEEEVYDTFSLAQLNQEYSLQQAYACSRKKQLGFSSSHGNSALNRKIGQSTDDHLALIDLLDSAGQEEYSSHRDFYYRSADGFLLVFSLCGADTLEDCSQIYEQILRVKDTDRYPCVLIGNKCDLNEERTITRSECELMSSRLGLPYFETSAKHNINIEDPFFELVRMCGRLNEYRFVIVGSGGVGKSSISTQFVSIPKFVNNGTKFVLQTDNDLFKISLLNQHRYKEFLLSAMIQPLKILIENKYLFQMFLFTPSWKTWSIRNSLKKNQDFSLNYLRRNQRRPTVAPVPPLTPIVHHH